MNQGAQARDSANVHATDPGLVQTDVASRLFESCGVRVYRRRTARLLALCGKALFLGSLLFGALLVLLGSERWTSAFGGWILVLLFVALATALGFRSLHRRPARERSDVLVACNSAGLAFHLEEGKSSLPREAIAGAYEIRRDQSVEVCIEKRNGDEVRLSAPGEADFGALLEVLRLEARRHRCRIVLGDPSRTVLSGVLCVLSCLSVAVLALLFGVPAAPPFGPTVWLVATTLLTAVVVRWRRPVEVVVGTDGVVVNGFAGARYVRYSDLREVCVVSDCLGLRTSSGALVWIASLDDSYQVAAQLAGKGAQTVGAARGPETFGNVFLSRASEESVLALGMRILEAMKGYEECPSVNRLLLLERGKRPVSEWKQSITGAMRAGPGYRELVPSTADLLAVVESPASVAEQRLGAAIALSVDADAQTRERVRAAAEGCAEESLGMGLVFALEK